MIFNNMNDIQLDIKEKLISYISTNKDVNLNFVLSLLCSYLKELSNIKEINNYSTYVENDEIFISILRDEEIFDFNINILMETRIMKINRILHFLLCY